MGELNLTEVREVDAPADVVWRTASDTSRYAEWVPETLEVVETDGPACLGSSYKERSRVLGPITSASEWQVIEYDEPRRQVHRSTSIPILKPLDIIMEVEQLTPSRTRFTISWHGQTALGPLGSLAVKAQRSSFAADIATTADNMAAAFEAAAAA